MLNPDTLVVVHCYAGDREQVENNLPVYLHHGCPVLVLSPEDAPITSLGNSGIMCWSAGRKGWIGPQTLERQLLHLNCLMTTPFKHFLLNDADSFCLSPKIPQYLYDDPDLIWSNEVVDTNPAPSMLPKLALQPPYFLSRGTVQKMIEANRNLPTSYFTRANPTDWPLPFPTECIDHLMLQLACGSGCGHFNFHTGASFETASSDGLEGMAAQVRHCGKVLIHSVKTKPVLDRLLREHAEWKKYHP